MERRYTFGGFTFGGEKTRYFNLNIRMVNTSGVGGMDLVGFALELTDEERLELIDVLSNRNGYDAETAVEAVAK